MCFFFSLKTHHANLSSPCSALSVRGSVEKFKDLCCFFSLKTHHASLSSLYSVLSVCGWILGLSWEGKSELRKKPLLKKILEKDVGLDALPPSFVNGCKVYERRKEKINAAKLRISRIKHPLGIDLGESGDIGLSECVNAGKKRKGKQVKDIDWEDFIIEALLLHEVKEEEIEKGHYNTLLELHVFNGGIFPEVPVWKA